MSTLTQFTNLMGRGQRGRGRGRLIYRGSGRSDRGSTNTAYYSPAEWNKLSPAQRDQVLNAKGTKRNVSAQVSDYTKFPFAEEGFDYDY